MGGVGVLLGFLCLSTQVISYLPVACRQFDSAPGHQYKAKASLVYSLGAFSLIGLAIRTHSVGAKFDTRGGHPTHVRTINVGFVG